MEGSVTCQQTFFSELGSVDIGLLSLLYTVRLKMGRSPISLDQRVVGIVRRDQRTHQSQLGLRFVCKCTLAFIFESYSLNKGI